MGSALTSLRYNRVPEGEENALESLPQADPEPVQTKEDLQKVILELKKKKKEVEELKYELDAIKISRIRVVDSEIEEAKAQADTKEDALNAILNPPSDEPPPPGPQCLMWVLSEYFNLTATIVIMSNIGIMLVVEVHPSYKADFFWLNQSFMVFYVMEIVVKTMLLQRGLLFGKLSIVWWNWLDCFIVLTGVLDMWVQPLLVIAGLIPSGGAGLAVFSYLRMLRLLRILKIIGLFLKSDTSWSEDPPFQLFIMGVIAFNSVLMGFESDMPDFFAWYYIEQILLFIYTLDILLRLKRWGWVFFTHETDINWNLLDLSIVSGGIVDQWVMPAISLVKMMLGIPESGKGGLGPVMNMLRMARLLRILRLVKLVKSIPPLFTLVVGIVEAFQGMMWVMVLTVLLLYISSLLGVKLIGHGLVFGGEAPLAIAAVFPSVMDSLFVLFKAMNGDWEALTPLLTSPGMFGWMMKLSIVIYTIVSSWAVLSILTAVVSENMINKTEEIREEMEADEKRRRFERSQKKLEEIFDRASGKDGRMNEEEFDKIMNNPNLAFELREAAGGLGQEDLMDLFELLSTVPKDWHDDDPSKDPPLFIERDYFIKSLRDESEPVTEKSVMRLEKRMKTLESATRTCVDVMDQKRSSLSQKR